MTEDQIKALAEQIRQKDEAKAYLNIVGACNELECALEWPEIRSIILEKNTYFLKGYVEYKEKEWPELCGKFKALFQKLSDLVAAELAEHAKLPWYKRLFS